MSWQWVALILGLALNVTIIIVAANMYEGSDSDSGQSGSSDSRRKLAEDQDGFDTMR